MSRFGLKTVWIVPVILAGSALPVFGSGNANLQLVKVVDNSHGGQAPASSWTTIATGPSPATTTISGAGGVGPTWVAPGTYALSETGTVYGYTNGTAYTCVVTPPAGGPPVTHPDVTSITLQVGEYAVCTITNSDNPAGLQLVKKVNNFYGGTATPGQWTTVALGPGPVEYSGSGGFGPYNVGPGTYALSEIGAVPGYTNGTSYSCVGTLWDGRAVRENAVTSITLGLGDSVVCTITNSQDPTTSILDAPYHVRYASNLVHGDSVVNITNTGANGATLYGPGFGEAAGNICVNVYAFSPDEQLISCCSCPVTPNGLVNLTANRDLVSNTLTGIRPDSIVIKLVATATGVVYGQRVEQDSQSVNGIPTFSGSTCSNSAALAGTDQFQIASGLLAWGTTLHSASEPASPSSMALTETQFLPARLSWDELRSIRQRCANIIGNGSTFGICRSCRLGGLGGAKQ